MTLIKLRRDSLFTDLSQHFRIYLVVFALKFFIMGMGYKRWRKVICVVKLRVIQPQPKYETRNFPNLTKRLLRDINWSQEQIGILKFYLVRLQAPSKQLTSLFVFSFILFIIPNKRKQWLKPLHKETKLKAENIAIVIMIMMIRIIAIIATV